MTAELQQAESEDRILLKKYIKHIMDYEGMDFLDDHCRYTASSEHEISSFTDREWGRLRALRDVIDAEKDNGSRTQAS